MEVRPDLKEVEPLLQKLFQFGAVFHKNNHEVWSHLRNKEDFDRIYEMPQETRGPLEEIYCVGRDLAVFMGSQLDAFNQPDMFPTLKKFVDSFDGGWLDEIDVLAGHSQAAKDIQASLDHKLWSVEQMIQLYDSQLSLLQDVRRTLDALKRSDTYAFDSDEVPTGSSSASASTDSTSSNALNTLYRIAALWFGDPKARFAKFFVAAGVALVAARWWQPIIQQLAVRNLGIPNDFLADADSGMFWSGWVLITIGVSLYVWIKLRDTAPSQSAA